MLAKYLVCTIAVMVPTVVAASFMLPQGGLDFQQSRTKTASLNQARSAQATSSRVASTCCLWQIHKTALGTVAVPASTASTAPQCETGTAAQVPGVRIRLSLHNEGLSCDQGKFIPEYSQLVATGNSTYRMDGFAYFSGEFTIMDRTSKVLFKGIMQAFDRIGTHHSPFGTEMCNQKGHAEGWLEGAGLGDLDRIRLRALIVVSGSISAGGPEISGSIDGTLVKCQ